MSLTDRLRGFDRYQQRRRWLGFIVAVLKKYADDQGGQLAALITYYAFFSLFPLLLVAVTVLGYVLEGDPSLRESIVNSFVRDIPIVGDTIKGSVTSLHGSGVALAIGLITSLWAGLGVTQAVQSAFNRIWRVPFRKRPDFLRSRLRGLVLLLALGGVAIAATVLTGIVSAGASGTLAGVCAIVLSLAVDVALFLIAFRLLTSLDLPWRTWLPGAVLAGVIWEVLQTAGGLLFTHEFKRFNATYSTFAAVLTVMAILYLGAQVLVIAAEINVVLKRRLWPRGLMAPLTDADRRALTAAAQMEERVAEQDVTVAFE
jgi:membrane protein